MRLVKRKGHSRIRHLCILIRYIAGKLIQYSCVSFPDFFDLLAGIRCDVIEDIDMTCSYAIHSSVPSTRS